MDSGDLEGTKKFLDQQPDALSAGLSADGDTALHIAVLAGHVDIVEELVGRMSAQEIAVKQKSGSTALNFAAIGGVTEIAELLVKKNRDLLKIPNDHDQIPVVVASIYGHRDLVLYLYMETPIEELDPTSKNNGAILLTSCIIDESYGTKEECFTLPSLLILKQIYDFPLFIVSNYLTFTCSSL